MIPQWRLDWVARENVRRGQGDDGVVQAWARQGDELRFLRSVAASFQGKPDPVFTDELVYLTVPGAQVVEAPHVTALPPVTIALLPPVTPAERAPHGISIGEEGTAVVTSRRLRFLGPGYSREWAYPALTGLRDDDHSPMTLLQVSGATPSGVLVPATAANLFRLHLRLAIADTAGHRAHVVGQLDHFIGWHQQQRPGPPPEAEPHEAPMTAWWTKGRLTAAAVVGGLILCCCGSAAINADDDQSAPPAATYHR